MKTSTALLVIGILAAFGLVGWFWMPATYKSFHMMFHENKLPAPGSRADDRIRRSRWSALVFPAFGIVMVLLQWAGVIAHPTR